MMQAANRRTNVVEIICKQMTAVHDQFEKGEGKYITHNTQRLRPAVLKRQVHFIIAVQSL